MFFLSSTIRSTDIGIKGEHDIKQFGCLDKNVSALIGRYFDHGTHLEEIVNGIVISSVWGTKEAIVRISDESMKKSVESLAMSYTATKSLGFAKSVRLRLDPTVKYVCNQITGA